MTLAADPRPTALPPPPETGRVVLHNVSWETYERLLTELSGQRLRLTYDQGDLEIMSPLPKHESIKFVLAHLFVRYAEERDIAYRPLGSTTWRRQDLLKGLEPDDCFYIRNEPAVRGKDDIRLPGDPPPDLAIEVDITSESVSRQRIYAALGVPELWRHDGDKLQFLRLTNGRYEPTPTSPAFPELRPADLEPFIAMRLQTDQNTLIKAWVHRLRSRP